MAKVKEKPAAENEDENEDAAVKTGETPIEFLASLASVLVTGLFIITFVMQSFVIPSSSMEDTLLIGDHVFVNRVQFAPPANWLGKLLPYRTPKHDDIVVFVSPVIPGLFVVKRIIGVPGDHLHLRDAAVYRNGEKLNQTFVLHKHPELASDYGDNFPSVPPSERYGVDPEWAIAQLQFIQGGELVVPPGHYFGMGDNRDVSLDSRFWGFIPQENLIGRPMLIYWSYDGEYLQTEIGDRVKSFLNTAIHIFDKTRWSRTLRIVR